MSLPVSQYEALLAQVRGLRRQAQHVQQLADPLLFSDVAFSQDQDVKSQPLDFTMDTLLLESNNTNTCYEGGPSHRTENETSEDESAGAQSTQNSVSSEPISQNTRGLSALYHGTWPVERTMWNSEPATLGVNQPPIHRQMEMPSVMSFASSSGAPMERVLITPDRSRRSSQQLEAKVDMVYSLLAMLGGQEHADMGETLLALSTNPESCLAMRQSGCIPLLVQLVQSDRDSETRKKASKALHNLVHSQPDEKLMKRESRILKLLETVCAYNEALRNNVEFVCDNLPEDGDRHPVQTIAHLMKLSFDEGHRQAICQLGGIHTIAKLVEAEHLIHGSTTDETHCILMRRYACMALTNLTFGDSGNKALLCSYKDFIRALVVQLQSPSDELRQVTASVLRNLSWRADSSSKDILKEVGSINGLMTSAMLDNKENTLKSILSALWNLSAHCTENKSEICAVRGALAFLVKMLLYKSSSKSLAIIENSGGILRNISSQIAVRDDYREILREHNCLQILLDQLKSPSLTIVSNACGTLWNLSAKNNTDQELLWQLGAPTMLRSLNHSKHKMIAMGSSATLKNLLTAKPGQSLSPHMDSTALSLDLPALPTLGVRKQKALLKDLDQNLSETFDNLDPPPDQKKIKNKHNQKEMSPNIKSPTLDLGEASFASLNINEPSTSFSHDRKSRIPQCSGPSSLPYMSSDSKEMSTSTPIKGKSKAGVNEFESMGGPSSSNKKYSGSKGKKGVSRRSSDTYKHKHLKGEYERFSGYVDINLEQASDYSLQYSEDGIHSDNCGNVVQDSSDGVSEHAPGATQREPYKLQLEQDDLEVIDNDKHKINKNTKEIVANMDEKDHCSTEDISDSEIQQIQIAIAKSESVAIPTKDEELVRLERNHEASNSLEFNGKDDRCFSFSKSDETIFSCELPNSPTHGALPSPRPRKCSKEERPQPAPRSLPKLNLMESDAKLKNRQEKATVALNSPTDEQHLPNIPIQQESVEDNTLQREESSEKQDVGREKKANISFDSLEISNEENAREMQNTRVYTTSNCSRINATSSKIQPKGFSRISSEKPTSRLPSRSIQPKSLSKNENSGSANTSIHCGNRNTPNNDSELFGDEVNQPISCDIINSLPSFNNTQHDATSCSAQMDRITVEGTNEATKAPKKDLNRKYDVSSREGVETYSCVAGIDECQDLSSKEINKSKTKPSQLNINNYSTDSESHNSLDNNIHPEIGRLNGESSITASMDTNNEKQGELDTRKIRDSECPIKENLSDDLKKSDLNKSLGKILDISSEYNYSNPNNCRVFIDKNGERLERSCNDSANVLDTRMLDPDAMIESLDRFTAELVSQASSHLQNKDSLYKSGTNDNTWDNSSPNEVTFPSISVSAPNVVSFQNDTENDTSSSNKNELDAPDGVDHQEPYSFDFSSFNTSTMTESTLIAMEATKIAAAFKESADMSLSNNSLISLELDHIQPPSHLNSLSNSIIGFDSKPGSPKMVRKKSLPSNIMVRRALTHSLSHTSSVDSIEQCKTNFDQMNDTQVLFNCTDKERSTQNDTSDSRTNFIINGPVSEDFARVPSSLRTSSSLLHFVTSSHLHSVTDIENINPPSLFNEITDLCNSLADVATSAICSETEVFEDCFTHVADNTMQTENDVTEFSDANSITPIQSDVNSSSNENTPKRQKTLGKKCTSKQRRALAKERYKTYTIAAEMVMKESLMNQEPDVNDDVNSTYDDFQTCKDVTESVFDDATTPTSYAEPPKMSKLSPKERRLSERSRFQTQVLEVSQLQNIQYQNLAQPTENEASPSYESPQQSPSKSQISIRKNSIQRRLANKERFKTQTLDNSRFLPDLPVCDSPPITDVSELHLIVEKEANKVLKTLRDVTTNHDELLECETLSLVSNEDESEHISGSSVNYRTYHKSWGLRRNIPMITSGEQLGEGDDSINSSCGNASADSDSEHEANRAPRKPKIVKPSDNDFKENDEYVTELAQPKGIRGRRKPLYTNSNINKSSPKSVRPSKNMTSNLVKNVTSSLKSSTTTKPVSKPSKIIAKPPTYQGKMACPTTRPVQQKSIPSPSNSSLKSSPKHNISRTGCDIKPNPLERQGTFTKNDSPVSTPPPQLKSKMTPFTSKIPSPGTLSKPGLKKSNIPRSGLFKSSSSDRNTKETNIKVYNRSTSADGRESAMPRRIQSSLSSHSLKNEPLKVQQNGAIKKTVLSQRSNSNTSLNGSSNTKKQVTSKIASIWKKIEESKTKTPPKNDSKKWIEAQVEPSNNTRDNVVILRNKDSDDNAPKRISRLGSFIVMDENGDEISLQQVVCGAANNI